MRSHRALWVGSVVLLGAPATALAWDRATPPGQPARLTGYLSRATVSFRTEPDRAPVLLAGCLDHRANALLQFGSSPREADVVAARRELAAVAAKDALA